MSDMGDRISSLSGDVRGTIGAWTPAVAAAAALDVLGISKYEGGDPLVLELISSSCDLGRLS